MSVKNRTYFKLWLHLFSVKTKIGQTVVQYIVSRTLSNRVSDARKGYSLFKGALFRHKFNSIRILHPTSFQRTTTTTKKQKSNNKNIQDVPIFPKQTFTNITQDPIARIQHVSSFFSANRNVGCLYLRIYH